jgi:hypothetical protein
MASKDKMKIAKATKNIKKVHEFANQFPKNAGFMWIADVLSGTLKILENGKPEETPPAEPKEDSDEPKD